jgi:hypothetical protein
LKEIHTALRNFTISAAVSGGIADTLREREKEKEKERQRGREAERQRGR